MLLFHLLACHPIRSYLINSFLYSYAGGGPPGKDLSAVAEVVQRILGEDNPSISVLDGGQDPAAMKLELLSKG